jgi:hypothetical protein
MMNDERFEAILIECLEALQTGTTLEQILARYPADAAQLEPALRVAANLSTLGGVDPSPAVQSRARIAFLAKASAMRPASPPTARVGWLLRPLVAFVTVVVLLAIVGGGVLGTSASSLPGDPLYSVKRSLESFELSLARDPVRRANLEESYAQRRVQEAKAVQSSKRAATVQFSALIQAMEGNVWTVGGLAVQVRPGTSVQGVPAVGEFVEVVGRVQPDGQMVADRIEVESKELVGVVEAMDASAWRINGQRVLVTAQTQIVGTARLGEMVEVHVRAFDDGTLVALKIDFEHQDESQPEPTPQPASPPRPSPSPTPSATPRPNLETPQPTVTRDERSTHTPEPTESQDGTRTPEPTESHGGTRAPEPTESHQGQSTPEPTESHDGTHAPEPTDSHSSSTPEPKPTENHGDSTPPPKPPDDQGVSTPAPQPTNDHPGSTPEPEPTKNSGEH